MSLQGVDVILEGCIRMNPSRAHSVAHRGVQLLHICRIRRSAARGNVMLGNWLGLAPPDAAAPLPCAMLRAPLTDALTPTVRVDVALATVA